MKLFLIIGIFLGSALTASAQFANDEAYERLCGSAAIAANGGKLPFICTNAMGSTGGPTGSGNNTGNGARPCMPTPASNNNPQPGYSLTNEGLTPQTAPTRGYALTRDQITPPDPVTGRGGNAATRGFSSFVAPSQRDLDALTKANELKCKKYEIACTCKEGEAYFPSNNPWWKLFSEKGGSCVKIYF